jgi:NADH-quinone oxidoreductase subunit L
MRKYGGLARIMPVTFVTFGLGYLALIGFPFLSGYFSKDAIIEAAFAQEQPWRAWVLGGAAMLGVALTAFYMTRLMLMTFFGEKRWQNLKSEDGRDFHPHESKPVMTVPMIILAIGSIGAGAYFSTGDNRLAHWLTPSLGELAEGGEHVLGEGVLVALSIGLMLVGAAAAWLFVGRKPVPVVKPEPVSAVVRAARNDLYGNALNETLVAKPGTWLTRALVYVDNKGVDGLVNGIAAALGGSSGRLRRLQTGFVRSYALTMLGGSILVVAALLAVRFA